MRERRCLIGLALVAALCILAFMTVGLRGNVVFVLELRATRLLALVQVALAIAVATVVFQTLTTNRILTPSIMGLDALYLFGQILLVFLLGGLGYAGLDPNLKFIGEVGLMMGLTLALLLPMLRARIDIGLMLLSGVVLGILFRSLSSLLARLIDPNDFAVVQGASFASFNTVQPGLTLLATIVTLVGSAIAWRQRHMLDVLALGRDAATSLGVEWLRTVAGLLLLVSLLTAVSTALVGPVAFFGLLVAALAARILDSERHRFLLPGAALLAVIVLVGGQALFQHLLGGATTLGVVIEFVGGLAFLALLVTKVAR